jgi:hypothetical protein
MMLDGRRKRCCLLLIVLSMAGPGALFLAAQNADMSRHVIISFETGSWQPHSLNDEPRFNTFGEAGATPYFGLGLLMPLGGTAGIRFSAGYWSLRDLNEVEHVHSLVLYPISLDIKYWFGPDFPLTAYVIYGAGIYWGVENETSIKKARGGWGARLGAGIDLALFAKMGLGLSFEYLYVHFKNNLGGVNDFSGPKVSITVFYIL